MTLAEFQREAARTSAAPFPERERLLVQTLGLCGESGEVADLVKKHAWHGASLDKAVMVDELGDVGRRGPCSTFRWTMRIQIVPVGTRPSASPPLSLQNITGKAKVQPSDRRQQPNPVEDNSAARPGPRRAARRTAARP